MNQKRNQAVQTLCILLIFCLFTFSSLLLVLTSAEVYQGISRRMNDNNQLRASLSYTANKIRTGDETGKVTLATEKGVEVLSVFAVYDGNLYRTLLYWHDGFLKEQLLGEQDAFVPENGDEVTPVTAFSMRKEGQTIFLSATTDSGLSRSLSIALRSQTR